MSVLEVMAGSPGVCEIGPHAKPLYASHLGKQAELLGYAPAVPTAGSTPALLVQPPKGKWRPRESFRGPQSKESGTGPR